MTNEISNRIAVWTALSEFYLDTELDTEDFIRIYKIFQDSKLTLDEIKKIDMYEVFPLLQGNLLMPAGEWAGFDESWLNKECTKRYSRSRFLIYRLYCKIFNLNFYWMRKRYWIAIEKLAENKIKSDVVSNK